MADKEKFCWRCDLPLDEERVCSGSNFSLMCAERAERTTERELKELKESLRRIVFHAEGRIANNYWHPHCGELLREVKELLEAKRK